MAKRWILEKWIEAFMELGFKKEEEGYDDSIIVFKKTDCEFFKYITIYIDINFWKIIDFIGVLNLNDKEYGIRKSTSIKELEFLRKQLYSTSVEVIELIIEELKEDMIKDFFYK